MDINGSMETFLGQALARKAADAVKGRNAAAGDRLKSACQEFEGILLNKMFQAMKKTVGQGGLLESSFQKEMYESVFIEKISMKIAQERSMGMADGLCRQLSGASGKAGTEDALDRGAEAVQEKRNGRR